MKLLCIDDSRNEASKHFQQWIEMGETYTLRREEGSLYQGKRYLLNEVKNLPVWIPELLTKYEPGFSAKRFIAIEDISDLEVEENSELLIEKV